MLMCDRPLPVDFAEAEGRAKPRVHFLSACRCCHHPVEAVAEGHVITHCDVQLANLVANRTLERGEPLLQALRAERIVSRLPSFFSLYLLFRFINTTNGEIPSGHHASIKL